MELQRNATFSRRKRVSIVSYKEDKLTDKLSLIRLVSTVDFYDVSSELIESFLRKFSGTRRLPNLGIAFAAPIS